MLSQVPEYHGSGTTGVAAISRSRNDLRGPMYELDRAARRMTNELGAQLAHSCSEYVES